MTTPQDPRRHPLQDDEVELARVLRALPAGEPSAKLDAAILAAASDAVAAAGSPASRRRVRPAWALPTWAIGTAAAAVLAVGVGVQLMPPPSSTQADRAQPPAAPASAITESDDRLGVEFVERPREIPPTYPPPEPRREQPHVERESAAAPSPPPPPPAPAPVAAPEPQAFPAPAAPRDAGAFAPPPGSLGETDAAASAGGRADDSRLRQSTSELNRLDAERRARARQLAQLEAAREEQAEAERAQAQLADAASDETSALGATAARDAAAPAPPAANEQIAADADVAEAAPVVAAPAPAAAAPPAVADRASATAPTAGVAAPATTAASKAEAFPPVAEDAKLLPAAWLERIRARWRTGDRDGARASLATLRERHPQLVIPDDLQPLLR